MSDLINRVARFFAFILVYFRPSRASPASQELDEQETKAERKIARVRTRRPKFDMRLKTSILDQLDDNTKIVGRMKTYFPSEYGLYSQIGAVIVPHDDPFVNFQACLSEPISPWFNQLRPGFGAVVTGNPRDERKGKDEPMLARLTHFLKVERPKDLKRRMFGRDHDMIQPIAIGSDLYIFTLYYDQRDWALLFPKKSRQDWKMCKFFERAFAVELPVEITKEGVARPLKLKLSKLKKTGRDNIAVKGWDYPYSKEYMASFKDAEMKVLTPQQFILLEVGFCLRIYEEANASMIQVRASKNGICTLVNVNVEQTPGFFDDRDDVIIEGIKKRIFHIVRAHERIGSKGVRIHFRGLREFVWNGYGIEISVPGRDHLDVREFNVTAKDGIDVREGSDMGELAAWLVANQKARFGAMVGKGGPMTPLRDRPAPPP